jgi:excisionase family DNA binding protein
MEETTPGTQGGLPMEDTEMLTPREVREWLKVSRSKAAQICSNEVASYRIGTLVRVRRQDMEEFLAKTRSQPASAGESSQSAMASYAK